MSTTMMTTRRRLAAVVAGVAALSVMVISSPAPTRATAESVTVKGPVRTTVFTRGEGGYHTFRLPALMVAADGTLLAFADAKMDGPGDWGDMDVVLKRSSDGGASWGPIQVLADDGPNKWSNSVPVLDRESGRIVVMTNRLAGDAVGDDVECGRAPVEAYTMHSDDDGATWSEPENVTAQINPGNWRMISSGPGHGIQLAQGEHAGRMIIPGRHSYVEPGQECAQRTGAGGHVMISDDAGASWRVGAVDHQGDEEVRPNEVTAVELSDGRVYFNARDQGISLGSRVDTTSSDGGETFDRPYSAANDVVTSQVEGSLVRLPKAPGHERDRVVLSVPGHPTSREKLTLWSSFDSGERWKRSYEVYDGPSAYSDMAVLAGKGGNREIGVLFEGGKRLYEGDREQTYHHDIYLVRVQERLLDLPARPQPVALDESGDHDGAISGEPKIVPGQFGRGLQLAGDFVELPLTDDLAFDNRPFAAAAWFRTGYSANNQALLYAHSRFGPRWTVQVEPRNGNRIQAQLSTDRGSTRTLTAPGDFVDDAWHHVVLIKDADGVALYVDGTLAESGASMGSGSVSAGARTGIRVGARIDGINAQFVGAVDEVQLFDTGLTAEQVAELVATNQVDGVQPVTRLPLNRIVRR